MTLDAEDIQAITAGIVAGVLAEIRGTGAQTSDATSEVLTRIQAMAYTKRKSHAAFSVWCKRWGVKPAFRGRYSRTLLKVAIDRESRARR